MARTKLLLVLCFLAAFAAGGAAGMVLKKGQQEHPRGHPSWLREQLKLSPEQQEQMGRIWSGMDANSRQHLDQRRALAEERDKAIAALMTPQQKPKYEQVLQDFDRKTSELSAERKLAFDQAVEKTKQMLTPEQNKQYDEILKRQRERGPGGGFPRRGGPRSRPATEESNAPHVGE